jgi:hypothetical protein
VACEQAARLAHLLVAADHVASDASSVIREEPPK